MKKIFIRIFTFFIIISSLELVDLVVESHLHEVNSSQTSHDMHHSHESSNHEKDQEHRCHIGHCIYIVSSEVKRETKTFNFYFIANSKRYEVYLPSGYGKSLRRPPASFI